MGTVMENKLLSAFKVFDLNGKGTLDKEELTSICQQLDPTIWTSEKVDAVFESLDKQKTGSIDYAAFAVWMTSGAGDMKGAFNSNDDISKLPGERLADGDKTDFGVDKIGSYLNNALDIKPEHYATPKASSKLTWLQEIVNLVDPAQNPGGFRICQNAVVARGAVGPLLGLAQMAQSDAVVIKALELLARTTFNNVEAAIEIVSHENFLNTFHKVLRQRELPEKLTVLQLAQAIAASSKAPKVNEMLPLVLGEVAPLLTHSIFMVLPRASFDIFVSISFSNPAAIVDHLSWAGVASWLSSNREEGKPDWMDKDNLTILACGLLAANVLALPAADLPNEEEQQLRQVVRERLQASNFLEFFVLAMEAAVAQREWPAHSGAYHSVSRLASMALILSDLGFRRELNRAVTPLTQAVEINPDECTTRMALRALRGLVQDFVCLEIFLTLSEFRSETLEVLHKAGDESEASDLLSYTTASENAIAAAQAAFELSECKNAPSVRSLAELFNAHIPMDGELSRTQLSQILCRVPIGPAKDVDASLSGDKTGKLDFAALAQRVYGTPTLLGWWPSLMEDTNSLWMAPAFQELNPPPLADLLFHFELGAKGMSGVGSDVILEEVLPAWKQTVEGELIEDLFAEIRGETLTFKEFGVWMWRYFHAVEKQRKDAERLALEGTP